MGGGVRGGAGGCVRCGVKGREGGKRGQGGIRGGRSSGVHEHELLIDES